MTRLTVMLLFGGESPEHDVSIMSARNIYAAMDSQKYDVKLCFIDKHGKWWLLDAWQDNLQDHRGVQLVAALGGKGFLTLPEYRVIHPDVIYTAIHGDTAEDGMIAGLASLLHIPAVGSGLAAHAIGWDKVLTKQLLEASGIKTAPFLVYQDGDDYPDYEEARRHLGGGRIFIKPARAGSSVGVSPVDNAEQFREALGLAVQYSARVLIEQAIVGRELEVGILGNPPTHEASDVGEIVAPDGFYSYAEKYASTSRTNVTSYAELDDGMRRKIRDTARRVFQVIGCEGQARVDFFLSNDNELFVNEINTLPGFTNISQYPKLWHDQGMRYPQLVDKLIALALEK